MDPVLRSFIKCDEAGGDVFSGLATWSEAWGLKGRAPLLRSRGSSFCGDKKYVVQSAVRQSAMLSATEGWRASEGFALNSSILDLRAQAFTAKAFEKPSAMSRPRPNAQGMQLVYASMWHTALTS